MTMSFVSEVVFIMNKVLGCIFDSGIRVVR